MALFGKSNDAKPTPPARRDRQKAQRFFEHAKLAANTRNYEYAIECYIDGFRQDPGNLPMHEALREVALKRKLAGGKPAKLTDKLKKGGKDAVARLLHAEMLAAKDPMNVPLLIDLMARAVEADTQEPELQLAELAYWVGGIVLEANQTAKSPSKQVYIKTKDLFAVIKTFAKAVEACRLALQMDPENTKLQQDMKNLEAERTMQEGGYEDATGQEGGFRKLVRDPQKQRQLEQQDAVTKTRTAVDEQIDRCRAEYNEHPEDLNRLGKLAAALTAKETDEAENEAVALLKKAFDQTGQYSYKTHIGDIRIKQFNRRMRVLQAQLKSTPDDAPLRAKLKQLSQQKLKFEHEEYADRVKNHPTDMALRYELGRRLFALKQYDEAIGAFQQAKVAPKHRVVSMEYLGRCYMAQGWFDEAVDTLRQGVEAYDRTDDRLAMDMRYHLMLSLKQLAQKNRSAEQAREAQKIASQILQTDINYRDIRKQLEEVRKLADSLAKEAG